MERQIILLVEDEIKVATFIEKGLVENSYRVDVANDGFMGKKLALSYPYDLIILDINLPRFNGFDVCKEVRKENINVPILMLTAMGTIDDKVNGFDAGADDYLVKPFEFKELLARIKALIKRTNVISKEEVVLKVKDLELNPESKLVKRNKKIIDLTAKEFLLLEYLIRNKNRVVSRAEIAEKIWEVKFDTGTNVIDVYVNFLRKKIDKDFSPKLIHTYIGMGYMLKDEVS